MSTKVGQNDACPCGSGKKYKRCCGLQVEVYGSVGGKGGVILGLSEKQEDVWIQAEKKRDLEFLAEKPDLMRRILEEARKGSRPFILVDRRTGVVQGFRGKDIAETITRLGKNVAAAEAIRSRLEILGDGEFLMCVISGSGHTGLYRMMAPEAGLEYLKLWGATSGRGH
jgi:hypothetical protein